MLRGDDMNKYAGWGEAAYAQDLVLVRGTLHEGAGNFGRQHDRTRRGLAEKGQKYHAR